MADELDKPSFSIQDTMEFGMGDRELLNDLVTSESASANPDSIERIETPKTTPKKQEPKKVEEAPPVEEKKNPSDELRKALLEDEEEEEDEIEEGKKPETKKEVEEEEEDGQSQFEALSKDLLKLGVFNLDEDEEDISIKTPEEFLERFKFEKQKGAIELVNNFIGQFGEDYQQAFDAIFVKGVNPKEYFSTFNNIQNFAEMDLKQEANQVAVVRQALLDQGFDLEDINTEIERIKNYGDLETVASKHHKVLVKKEAAKLNEMEQQKAVELQQRAMQKQEYVKNVQTVLQDKLKSKEFDGIPLNPKIATELQDFLLVDRYKTPSGEHLTEFDKAILDLKRPENHSKKVKVALILKTLEKDPTLSTIQKAGVTKSSNQIFDNVVRQKTKDKTDNKPKSWFGNSEQ